MTHFLDEIYYLLDAFATIARFAQNLHNAVGAARAADSIDSNPSTSRLKRKTDEDNIKKFQTENFVKHRINYLYTFEF